MLLKLFGKRTYILKSETLLERTSTKIFFKDFANSLRKIKIKQKGLQSFRTAAFPTEQRCFISSENKETLQKQTERGPSHERLRE